MKYIAQIFGVLGMAALFMSYQQTERKKLIGCKLIADVMWVVHYMLLGAVGGAIPNFVGIFREIVFMQRSDDGKKWAKSPAIPVVFILINWTLAIVTWKTALSLLPICASTFVTISLWVKNPVISMCV